MTRRNSARRRQAPALPPAFAVPTKPASVCYRCWKGPFTARLGLSTNLVPTTHKDGQQSEVVPEERSNMYTYQTSPKHVKRGMAAGCIWCRFVATLSQRDADVSMIKVGRSQSSEFIFSTPSKASVVSVVVGPVIFNGCVYTDADDPASPYFVARGPVLDVGSSRALSLAKGCIQKCENGHKLCSAISVSPDSPLPTRLVDCSHPEAPRLVFTYGQRGRYLALSYVWGEDQNHRTTTHNLSTYADGINPSLLPQTILDGIRVTHALGFQHLWVDSLCIVQDSVQNQRHEIGQMHMIYRHAHLTIIAASARRVSEGFLQDRPKPLHDITLPFICPPPSPVPVSDTEDVATALQVGTVYVSTSRYNYAQEPISARGWCMQEYLMSPRALIFTSETLQFRCQTETQNIGHSFYRPNGERRLPDMLLLPDPPTLQHGSGPWGVVHDEWLRVVEDYSQRSISDPSDKLVACGAIAQAFQHALGSEYLAGLWRDTLLIDLLWCKAEGTPLTRPAEYRAPSWSWAAVEGRVRMVNSIWPRAQSRTGSAEVVRCEVALEDSDLPLGKVTGGTLVLRTALMACVVHRNGIYRTEHRVWSEEQMLRMKFGVLLDREDGVGERMGRVSIDTEADTEICGTVWAVLIFYDTSDPFKDPEGLLVVPVETRTAMGAETEKQNVIYRRIGYFRMDRRDAFQGVSLEEIELV